jgi:hypothetical protein
MIMDRLTACRFGSLELKQTPLFDAKARAENQTLYHAPLVLHTDDRNRLTVHGESVPKDAYIVEDPYHSSKYYVLGQHPYIGKAVDTVQNVQRFLTQGNRDQIDQSENLHLARFLKGYWQSVVDRQGLNEKVFNTVHTLRQELAEATGDIYYRLLQTPGTREKLFRAKIEEGVVQNNPSLKEAFGDQPFNTDSLFEADPDVASALIWQGRQFADQKLKAVGWEGPSDTDLNGPESEEFRQTLADSRIIRQAHLSDLSAHMSLRGQADFGRIQTPKGDHFLLDEGPTVSLDDKNNMEVRFQEPYTGPVQTWVGENELEITDWVVQDGIVDQVKSRKTVDGPSTGTQTRTNLKDRLSGLAFWRRRQTQGTSTEDNQVSKSQQTSAPQTETVSEAQQTTMSPSPARSRTSARASLKPPATQNTSAKETNRQTQGE